MNKNITLSRHRLFYCWKYLNSEICNNIICYTLPCEMANHIIRETLHQKRFGMNTLHKWTHYTNKQMPSNPASQLTSNEFGDHWAEFLTEIVSFIKSVVYWIFLFTLII